MASFERFVNSSTLDITVPNEVLEFPPQDIDYSTWVRKLRSDKVERERAFFGISLCGVILSFSYLYISSLYQMSFLTSSSFFAWNTRMRLCLILRTHPLHFSHSSLIPKFPTTLPTYLLPRHPPRQRSDRARRRAQRL